MAGLAATTLSGAGSANASSVSISGVGNTSQCNTSNFGDVAVVIGSVVATAQGGGNIAWAIGNKADARRHRHPVPRRTSGSSAAGPSRSSPACLGHSA